MNNIATRSDKTKQVVIANGEVRIEEITVKKAISMKDFYNKIIESASCATSYMPPGTIHYRKYTDTEAQHNELFVYELPPDIRRIIFTTEAYLPGKEIKEFSDRHTRFIYEFKLSFPYIYFIIQFTSDNINRVRAYAAKNPIIDDYSILCAAPFTNLHDSHTGWNRFCLGSISAPRNSNYRERIKTIINGIFLSESNIDLSVTWPKNVWESVINRQIGIENIAKMTKEEEFKYSYKVVKSWSNYLTHLMEWERLSDNQFAALNFQYLKIGTIKEILENLTNPNYHFEVKNEWI